jgi:hypothetical protein
MGEHYDENTTKIAIVSVATFIETCSKSLDDLSKTGMSSAGATHLQSIKAMLSQCAISLRSYAIAHKTQSKSLELESLFPHDHEPDLAIKDESFLAAEQEEQLAKLMGFIEEETDGPIN